MEQGTKDAGKLKLYMILLGSKATGRHVEQHDFFFGIAHSLNELVPEIKNFWPDCGTIHIDGWREVNFVDGYRVTIRPRQEPISETSMKLYFINLGGYQENKLEEQHYTILTVKADRAAASREAKETLFYKEKDTSHIDDKYGIDVDDLYEIEDILSPSQKERYRIELTPSTGSEEDTIHLGYLKLSKLK